MLTNTTHCDRRGLTVLELLVTMSIIGILAALVLPAIGAIRESARRVSCSDHLREVGLAVHSHYNSERSLPVGWQFDAAGDSAYGWAVALLPYVGQPALSDSIDRQQAVGDRRNDVARGTRLEVMLCPSDLSAESFVLFAESEDGDEQDDPESRLSANAAMEPSALLQLPVANYVGVFGTYEMDDTIPAPIGDGAFLENRKVHFRDFQRGLSKTFLVGERTMAQVPSTWFGVDLAGEDAAARLVGAALEGINKTYADECDFSSRHPGGAYFLYGDGHVDFISEAIDLRLYHQSARLRPNGGN